MGGRSRAGGEETRMRAASSSGHGRRAGALLILALAAAWLGAASAAAEPPLVRVGMVVDGPWEGNDAIRDLTRAEVVTLTGGEFDVRFPDALYLVGDWTVATAGANLEKLLADPEVDLVITWGLLSSHAVC